MWDKKLNLKFFKPPYLLFVRLKISHSGAGSVQQNKQKYSTVPVACFVKCLVFPVTNVLFYFKFNLYLLF